ncbi:hypothetical protein ADH70_013010 [Blautia pseudococcoides]|uniref:Uncharacterized protein n=1 Tax=Blautia pseudococcoides TaxID=1796616 RepID=A0A1C7IB15_9FIRM|nr:hypothetical protein A4V09_14495 [Blautia pseudococcoides]ASU29662.1 hypothetical protein ADH70_013010 [Blautia pseudococcoides]
MTVKRNGCSRRRGGRAGTCGGDVDRGYPLAGCCAIYPGAGRGGIDIRELAENFSIIRINAILSSILKYNKTLILPRIYHD